MGYNLIKQFHSLAIDYFSNYFVNIVILQSIRCGFFSLLQLIFLETHNTSYLKISGLLMRNNSFVLLKTKPLT